jgi:hypothetical protein
MWYATIWIAPAKNAAFLSTTTCGSEGGLRAHDAE